MRQGIFGGTFNPVHNGHLLIAEYAADELSLDRILFVPAKVPVHKELALDTSAEHRAAMIELAIQGNARFALSRIELDRTEPSYSVLTVSGCISECPGDEWFFILGADAFAEIETWKRYAELIQLITFAVMCRPGDTLPQKTLAPKAHFLDNPPVDISSSSIRSRVSKRQSIRYMVPDEVRDYIISKELYLE